MFVLDAQIAGTGSITRNTYDAVGHRITETDALNRVTRYEYDNAGRQTAVIHADGSRELTAYDEEGNEIVRTDRAGKSTRPRIGQLTHGTYANA